MSRGRHAENAGLVDDEAVLEALEGLHDDDETIDGGGVSSDRLADALPIARTTTKDRLASLRQRGRIELDWGFVDGRPMRAYAPTGGGGQ